MKNLNFDSMDSICGGAYTALVYVVAGQPTVVAIYDPPATPAPIVHIFPEDDLPNIPALSGLTITRFELPL